MRGFTTVRDVGGPAFGLKRAIDRGIHPGPRIYPSGAMITVTSGHGGFPPAHRPAKEDGRPAHPDGDERVPWSWTAPTRCVCASASSFMQGAVLIK